MGFWSEVSDMFNHVGKEMSKSTEVAHSLGKMNGANGSASEYYKYQDAGATSQWLAAYKEGYNEGLIQRRNRR